MMTYSSQDIADVTGASLRQLQWWDEQRLIQPKHVGHRRQYSELQKHEAMVLMELRKKGYSLQAIRVVFRSISRTWQGKPLGLIIEENPGAFLLAMEKRGEIVADLEMALQVASDSPVPVAFIQLPGTSNGAAHNKPLPPARKRGPR